MNHCIYSKTSKHIALVTHVKKHAQSARLQSRQSEQAQILGCTRASTEVWTWVDDSFYTRHTRVDQQYGKYELALSLPHLQLRIYLQVRCSSSGDRHSHIFLQKKWLQNLHAKSTCIWDVASVHFRPY